MKVPGVEAAAVSYDEKIATITFEDDDADVKDLNEASSIAGSPARLLVN